MEGSSSDHTPPDRPLTSARGRADAPRRGAGGRGVPPPRRHRAQAVARPGLGVAGRAGGDRPAHAPGPRARGAGGRRRRHRGRPARARPRADRGRQLAGPARPPAAVGPRRRPGHRGRPPRDARLPGARRPARPPRRGAPEARRRRPAGPGRRRVGDVARTVVLHRFAALPPGSPASLRPLAGVGRRLLVGRYLATYRRSRPVGRDALDQWIVVRAAARLGDPVPDEHPHLLRFVQARIGRGNETSTR